MIHIQMQATLRAKLRRVEKGTPLGHLLQVVPETTQVQEPVADFSNLLRRGTYILGRAAPGSHDAEGRVEADLLCVQLPIMLKKRFGESALRVRLQ